jgi:hypothetical protein
MVICHDLRTWEELAIFLKESEGMLSEKVVILLEELEAEIETYYD